MASPGASAAPSLQGFEVVVHKKTKMKGTTSPTISKPAQGLYARPRRWTRAGKGSAHGDDLRQKTRRGGMADSTANQYLVLHVQDLPPFAPRLPFELLNMIHPDVMSRPRDYSYRRDIILTRTASGHAALVTGPVEIGALLSLNKFYNNFFGTYLDEFVPTHINLRSSLRQCGANDSYDFEVHDLNKLLSTTSRGLYLCINSQLISEADSEPNTQLESALDNDDCLGRSMNDHAVLNAENKSAYETSKDGSIALEEFMRDCAGQWLSTPHNIAATNLKHSLYGSEKFVSAQIANAPAFTDLLQALQALLWTEDIVISIQISNNDAAIEEQHPESDPKNVLFESLVTAVEKMPHIKRYSVRLGLFGAFGSRESSMGWDVRITHDTPFWQYDANYFKLLNDLHVFR